MVLSCTFTFHNKDLLSPRWWVCLALTGTKPKTKCHLLQMESVPEFLVTKCPEEGPEVQRGKVGCPGSHSMWAAITTQGYLRLEKPHQSTSDKTRNTECQFIPCPLRLGWMILCCGARACPVHCRRLGSIPGLHSLEASSNLPPPRVTIRNDSRRCQMSLGRGRGEQKPLWLMTIGTAPRTEQTFPPIPGVDVLCFA